MFSVEKNPRVPANLQIGQAGVGIGSGGGFESGRGGKCDSDVDGHGSAGYPTKTHRAPSHSWTKYEGPRGLHLRCRRWGQPTSSVRKSMECERREIYNAGR